MHKARAGLLPICHRVNSEEPLQIECKGYFMVEEIAGLLMVEKMEELLTVQEVASILRVDEATVRRWIKNGTLEAVKLPHRGKREVHRIKRTTLQTILKLRD
jgi:excisionase family DNA binding protein